MATLTTLLVDAAAVNPTTDWATGTYVDIDEGVAGADAAEVGDDTNVSTDRYAYYRLSDTDADLDSMTTILYNVMYRVTGAQTNNRSLYVQIVTDEASPVSLTTEATVATNITDTTVQTSGATGMTISGTPTKAQWDNALVKFRLNITKNKGGDTNGIRVDTVEFTGTYTAAAASQTATTTVFTGIDFTALSAYATARPLLTNYDCAAANRTRRLGPFGYNSNFYVVGIESAVGDHDPAVWKTTDPSSVNWGVDEVTIAGPGVTTGATMSMASSQYEKYLDIAWADQSTTTVYYACFDMSADAWIDVGTSTAEYQSITVTGTTPQIDIARRSDGTVVIFAGSSGAALAAEVFIRSAGDDTGTWDAGTTVDADGSWVSIARGVADDDDLHLFYRSDASTKSARTLRFADDSLSTQSDHTGGPNAMIEARFGHISYDDSGTAKIKGAYSQSTTNVMWWEYREDGGGDADAGADTVGTIATFSGGETAQWASIERDPVNGYIYCIFSEDQADEVIYYYHDTSSWSGVQVFASKSTTSQDCHTTGLYTRDGFYRIGILWNDGTNVVTSEITLSAVPAGGRRIFLVG